MPLQIRRGTAAERTGLTTPLAIGELLYVTDQGKLYIGDGTSIGSADIAGNAGQGGKGLIITGFTTEEAQDATNTLFSNGTHTNITFSYNDSANSLSAAVNLSSYIGNINVNGTVEADFIGSVFAADSSILVDAIDRKFFGDLEGNVLGSVIGDLKGSIFGQDSTLLVDGISSTIPASVVTGTFTGNVIGNVIGNVTGSVITNYISSSDSSSIICDTPFIFQTSLEVEGELTVEDGGNFNSFEENTFPLSINQFINSVESSSFNFRKSRGGTPSAPVSVIDGDKVGSIIFSGHDGTVFSTGASIQARVSGTVSTGIVPMELRFILTDTTGTIIEPMTLQSIGTLTLRSNDLITSPLEISTGHNNASSTKILLRRSRTDTVNPTAVTSGDALVGLSFQGYDGSNYQFSATIQAKVDDTVSSGVVPGRLEFVTNNSSGVAAVGMALDKDRNLLINNIKGLTNSYVTFGQMPVLPTYADETAADTAIGGSGNRVNGMMYYDSGASKIKSVVGGSWAVVGP